MSDISLHNLDKLITNTKKRLGRGYGSGKGGHTSSKGMKGQKSRSGGTGKVFFEGTKSNKDFFRKTPMLRGKGKLKSYRSKPVIIKTSDLNKIEDPKLKVIDLDLLIKLGLVLKRDALSKGVKVLKDSDLERDFEFKVPTSKSVLNSSSK